MIDLIPNQVKANADNDLLFRTSMMSEEEKKKKEEILKEASENPESATIEYFTD